MIKKDNIFIKSTIILILSGLLTKVIGFVIRIVYTRIIGPYGISLYTIATPTYSLLLTIATLSIPISISKLVAENKGRSIRILTSAATLILGINAILIIIILLTHNFIATTLLKEPLAGPILVAMVLTLPFVSISSVLKGYFAGKQNMLPHATSNIIEQIIRLIIIIIVLPILIDKGIMYAVIGLVLLTIISEISSIIVFFFFLPRKINLRTNLSPSMNNISNILDISLPTVSSRIIGNIGYFFEPIILTNLLLYSGYPSSYILAEYGAYNAYSISLLTMPSFFIAAVSTSTFIYIFRDPLLFSLYKTTIGSKYIKILAPVFVLFYLEGVLTSSLQALGDAKTSMKISLWGVVIKLIVLSILSLCHIGIYSLVISEIVNILFVVFLNFKALKKYIN